MVGQLVRNQLKPHNLADLHESVTRLNRPSREPDADIVLTSPSPLLEAHVLARAASVRSGSVFSLRHGQLLRFMRATSVRTTDSCSVE